MKLKKPSVMFYTLMIAVSAMFAVTAYAQLAPGPGVPVSTGFSAQGQFPQGVQAGTPGPGQTGGFAGGIQTAPGMISPGQQPDAGIWTWPGDIRQAGTLPWRRPGEPTCQCIRAPCYCQEPGGPLPPTYFPGMNLPPQYQPFQTQPV